MSNTTLRPSSSLPAMMAAPSVYRPQTQLGQSDLHAAVGQNTAPRVCGAAFAAIQPKFSPPGFQRSTALQRQKAGIPISKSMTLAPPVYRPPALPFANAARVGVLQRVAAPSSPSAGSRPFVGHTGSMPRMAVRGVIQRCVSCGHNDCISGEKCKYDRSHEGLFSSSAVSSAKGVLPYGSSNAKAQSGKAFGTELEHVIPGAALRQMGQGGNYRYEYTVPLPKEVHRNGVSGAGGGISSTGSSFTSTGWAQHLSGQATDYDVVRLALTDGINAMLMNNAFSQGMAVQYSDWLTAQYELERRITQTELGILRNLLVDRFYNQR
jgi:hypothetical protein